MRASSSARSPTSWGDSSTSRWWWPRRTPTATATGCSSPMRQYARERLVEAGEAATVEARHLALLPRARAGGRSRGRGGRADRRARPPRGRPRQPARGARLGAAARTRAGVGAGRPHVADVDGRQSLPGGQPLAGGGAGGGPGAHRAARARRCARRAGCGSAWGGRTGSASSAPSGSRSSGRWATARAVAHALDEVGVYEYMAGRYDRAERLYAESRALAEELGDRKVLGGGPALRGRARPVSRRLRGRPRGAAGQPDPVARASRRRRRPVLPGPHRRPVRRRRRDRAGRRGCTSRRPRSSFAAWTPRRAVGYVLAGLGDVARAQGLIEPARERLAESLAHFREARDAMGTAFALNRLGNLAGATGQHELGREWLEEALALRRELGDRRGVGMTLGNLGVLAAARRRPRARPVAARRGAGAVRGDRRRARPDGDAAQPRQPRRRRRRA